MKKYTIIVAIVICLNSIAQQQFKARYYFKSSRIDTIQMDITPDNCDITAGYEVQPDGTKFPIHKYCYRAEYEKMKFPIHGKLKGVIDFRDGNDLYFHFWYFTPPKEKCKCRFWKFVCCKKKQVARDLTALNEKNFKYTIDWKNKTSIKINFKYRTLTATNISVKYEFDTKTVNTNFFNFNIAYLWVFGRTKIFKNQDIQPRDQYFAIGPYAGVTNYNSAPDLSQYGYTFGGSAVWGLFGLNIVASAGYEFGTGNGNPHFYTGIGIGFNLVTISK